MSPDAGMGTSVACSVAPMLSVRHGARAVEFYKAAFGAIEVYRVEDPTGSVLSRLSIDGAEDAMVPKALAAGAILVVPVENAYGWRLGRVVDPFGHHWEIGYPLATKNRRSQFTAAVGAQRTSGGIQDGTA